MNEKDYMAFFNEPEFKKILERYESMLANGKHEYFEAEQLTDIAEYYANQGKKQEADNVIDFALAMHPNSTDPLVFKARTLMLNGNKEAANQIVNSIPNQEDREVIFLRAEILINSQKAYRASEFLHVLTRNEDDMEELYYTEHDIANIFMDYGHYKLALYWLNAAEKIARTTLKSIPKLMQTKEQQAVCYKEDDQLEKAVKIINQMLDENPYLYKQWTLLGNIYNLEGKYDEAIEAFDFALAINDTDYDSIFSKANSLTCLRNNDEALKLYLQCIEAGYALDMAHYTCGMIYNDKLQFSEAISHLETALKLMDGYNSTSFHLYFNLAFAYASSNQAEEAIKYVELAYELEPNDAELNIIKNKIYDSLSNS